MTGRKRLTHAMRSLGGWKICVCDVSVACVSVCLCMCVVVWGRPSGVCGESPEVVRRKLCVALRSIALKSNRGSSGEEEERKEGKNWSDGGRKTERNHKKSDKRNDDRK